MKYYLGVTDWRWYSYLSQTSQEDVNFWQPGGKSAFRVLEPGGPFLFKLKSPYNAIGGIGFFTAQSQVPLSVAWDTFRQRNGFETIEQFRAAIQQIRGDVDRNPTIGCIALTNPVFFQREDWIPLPANWSNNIVVGKSYNTEKDSVDAALWRQVQATLTRYHANFPSSQEAALVVAEPAPLYGAPVLRKVRIGQGAFRLSVTDAYTKRCAITGEKTLPVLEAAHIKPYAEAGPNTVTNGLLLRSDMHKLFDDGYITVTPDYKIEISSQIREEFENGREYYQYHGKGLFVLPSTVSNRPGTEYLNFHNTTIFRP
ncbi:HNH endonuclease [Hymenobacter sp. CRA2]|uniref:HNH endonuclease n=1 Tax=Hymenobacter sp. CRA2 TaxID=1955620 RepID=UPI00099000C0|nr:HNH endonuclease [Hymenobacter sp. CRA2]OON68208.1 hypothetical protein B0919_13695 [Hymenobacter sp. CRA2]